MNEAWIGLLGLMIGSIVTYIVAPIITARFAKTPREQNIEIAERLSQITDKTAKQLFEKLEQIDRLEAEAEEREKQRRERDRRISEMEAELHALRTQMEHDAQETEELRVKYDDLKTFTKSLIVALEKKGISLPELEGRLPESISGWKWPKEGK